MCLAGPLLEAHLERRLLPELVGPLRGVPVLAGRVQGQVEVVDDPGQDEAHLVVGEVAADAVAGPVAEGAEAAAVVAVEGRGRVVDALREPALRAVALGVVEVGLGGVHGQVVDADDGLGDEEMLEDVKLVVQERKKRE